MTDTETRSVLRTLQSAYPYRYRNMSKLDADDMVRQWSALDPFAAVKTAVENWVSSQRFHPTIADINALMEKERGQGTGQPTLEDFRRMLRFYISMLRDDIKKFDESKSEADRQQAEEARKKIDEVYAKHGHILEGQS